MTATTMRYLKAADVAITPVPGAVHPRVEIHGDRCILAAHFKRAFPLTNPNEFISIQTPDEVEVGVLESLDGLPQQALDAIAAELDRRYFTPIIEKIEQLKQDAGMWKFVVETQRGPAEFYVRNWRDSAHETAPGRWQVHSVDGLRFEIMNVDQLDVRSQDLLEQLF